MKRMPYLCALAVVAVMCVATSLSADSPIPRSETPAPVNSHPQSLPMSPPPVPLQPTTVASESSLEQRIQALEARVNLSMASVSARMEDLRPAADLKAQLNELYAQRPENQPRHGDPLDQGADVCPGTYIAALPYTDNGTTAGYANNYTAVTACTPVSNAPDVVYYFVASLSGSFTVSLCGSSYDTYLYVVEGACTLSQIACNDDYCGLQSEVTFNGTAGQTYTIFVDGYASASGAYVINVTDNCSVPCQPGDITECAEYPGPGFERVDCDGGCNNVTWGGPEPIFQYISCNQTVCGVGFTYTDQGALYRDTDWYEFTVMQMCTLRVTGTAEFPVQFGFLPAGCPTSFITSGLGGPCSPLVVSTPGIVNPGNYILHVSVANQAIVPTPRNYRATLQCIPINCLACQPGDIPECGESMDPSQIANDCDGGSCNTFYGGVASYLPIQDGQTYCSNIFTYPDGTHWDTDWYTFTLTQPESVVVTVQSDNFVPWVWGFSQSGDCVMPNYYNIGAVCSSVYLPSVGCLPPGTYYIKVQAGDFGVWQPRPYRLTLNYHPCCFEQTVVAPGSVSGNTCGAGNDCSHRPSPEQVVRVNIPHAAQWSFSLCGSSEIWNSYLELTDGCCGSVIEYNDDACGTYGQARINCYYLPAGTYYVAIEGYLPTDCGAYTLTVTECSGRCCYGDPASPTCTVTNPITCTQLGGQYFEGETCANGCAPRPDCFPGALYGQQPYVPGEAWNSAVSDVNTPYEVADNFSSLTGPIGSIRFWGMTADYTDGVAPCTENPMQFDVRFYTNVSPGVPGTLVQTYSGTVGGTPTYPIGGPPSFQVREYQLGLTPPLSLATGWVEVIATDPNAPNCDFYWMWSPQGNGSAASRFNSGAWNTPGYNLAFCLGGPCLPPDSVTIQVMSPTVNRIILKARETGMHRLYWTTAADNTPPSVLIGQAYLYAGWWMIDVSSQQSSYARYMIRVDCGVDTAPPVLESPPVTKPLIFVPLKGPEEDTMR